MSRPALLVTGSPRSGTTWTGRMLAAAPELHYVHEPFNPHSGADELGRLHFERHFTYIHPGNAARYRDDLERVVEGRFDVAHALRGVRRPRQLRQLLKQRKQFASRRAAGVATLFKDPIALMSAPWLCQEFGMQALVLIRHPGSFVASINRLEWNSRPFRWALPQDELMRDLFAEYRTELERMRDQEYDVIDHASMAWKLHHHAIRRYRDEHSDWLFRRHEELSAAPVEQFKELYEALDLTWTDAAAELIAAHSDAANPDAAEGKDKALKLNSQATIGAWRQALTEQDIEIVRARTAGVFEDFYHDQPW
ncbi:MAG: sulfotransferase [Pseudomonadota bacterium]